MDIKELKEIIEKEKGKIIIVENGKPVIIAMSFEEYMSKKEEESEEKIIPFKKEESELPGGEEELKIEDLPF
jgi:PHD/YefM family antitoxin component YafN of YafNO toxin-antitoxin module